MKQDYIESRTALKHGWGTAPWRWVSGLTPAERRAVKNGGIVFFRFIAWHWSQTGVKVVTYRNERYDAREPTPSELAVIESREEAKESK
jgi:hypothetical protein